MKNKNKILLSLMTASVSALAVAPYILSEDGTRKINSNSSDELKSIDINVSQEVNNSGITKEELQAKEEIKSYVEAVLTKKSPIVNIGKNINVVTENYANIKKEVLIELGAGYDANNGSDSTGAAPPSAYTGSTNVDSTQGQVYMCHSACHGVCHSNCHGARGWR